MEGIVKVSLIVVSYKQTAALGYNINRLLKSDKGPSIYYAYAKRAVSELCIPVHVARNLKYASMLA